MSVYKMQRVSERANLMYRVKQNNVMLKTNRSKCNIKCKVELLESKSN